MSVNIISLGISCPTMKRFDRVHDRQNYVEYQKLRLTQTGRLKTATMSIAVSKNPKGKALIKTCAGIMESTTETVLENIAEILEIGRGLPLMRENCTLPVAKCYAGTLPEYGKPVKTKAEAYAERLKADKWDARKYDPAEIPIEWKSYGRVKGR